MAAMKFEDHKELFEKAGVTPTQFEAMSAADRKELVTRLELPEGDHTTDKLDEDAHDNVDVKTNSVGASHDEAGPDLSPTTNDVHNDLDKNISDAREEGLRNGLAEQA